ncbi:hypothetical protein KUV26_23060 [Leisingera daeponensis]|uniref:PA14 domain-containing protein n=1 Tax=Leisingera daeponensis TaxID=405746 RepID=A0ABS7NNR5_9RHOB|nr:PA14 domain-containing protein [Leisingera daeponensis]MBY6142314.1 hypothetical protein [Leisingera daeponensis]
MAEESSNHPSGFQNSASNGDGNWLQETERELTAKTSNAAPTFGETDGIDDAERQALLHQGTAQFQKIEEEAPAPPDDRPAPDETVNHYTEITPPSPGRSDFTSLQQITSARNLPGDDPAPGAISGPQVDLAGDVPVAGLAESSAGTEPHPPETPASRGEGAGGKPADNAPAVGPVPDLPETGPLSDPEDPVTDEAPEGLALDNSSVAENADGAAIGTLSASDPEGGAVSFTVDDARFEVQGDGTLKLKDGISLDHEAEPSITVTVTATDAGGNSTDQDFTLTVTDVDEAPEGLALDNSSVVENAAGAAIGTLSASDPEGGAISFTVDDARFEVQGDGTLKLKDGISLDHETEPSITVTVTATDSGGNSTDQPFTLTVTDVDEAPQGVALDNGSVAENAPGAAIGTLSASDPEGGAVSFTVDDTRFEVQGDGTLKLKDGISLDHEAEPSITVTVTATDAGGNSTDQDFTLTVTDMNEDAGTFSLDNSALAENDAGATVGTISSDTPGGGPYSYSVDDARFEVQGDGTLKLKDGISLDHEAEPSITVTVTATDAGGNSTDQPFTLTVTDVDEAPEGLALDNSSVAENAAGAAIGTLSASDPEGGPVSFTVDDARFEVQGDGTLKLKDGISLDHEAEPSITVTVTATDAGGNSTNQDFTLTVTDVPVIPAAVTVSTSFHVEQIAVADGVLNILDIDYNSEPLDEFYTQSIDFPNTPFTFFDLLSPDVFATKVTGRIDIAEAGTYEFRLTTGDTALVWIDGASTIVKAVEGVVTVEVGSRTLSAGEHEVVIHHLDLTGDAEMTFEWRGPGETDFSLVTPSPLGSIENNDHAGFIIDVDTGTSTLEAVKLTNVPDNWVFSAGEETAVASGGEVDVTGWDLSQLVIAPASDDLGTVTLDLETTLRSTDGEVETGTTSFDVNVLPEDGIVLDVDIDLGILGAGVDLSMAAAQTDAEYASNALLPAEDLAASLDEDSVTPASDNGSPVLF